MQEKSTEKIHMEGKEHGKKEKRNIRNYTRIK